MFKSFLATIQFPTHHNHQTNPIEALPPPSLRMIHTQPHINPHYIQPHINRPPPDMPYKREILKIGQKVKHIRTKLIGVILKGLDEIHCVVSWRGRNNKSRHKYVNLRPYLQIGDIIDRYISQPLSQPLIVRACISDCTAERVIVTYCSPLPNGVYNEDIPRANFKYRKDWQFGRLQCEKRVTFDTSKTGMRKRGRPVSNGSAPKSILKKTKYVTDVQQPTKPKKAIDIEEEVAIIAANISKLQSQSKMNKNCINENRRMKKITEHLQHENKQLKEQLKQSKEQLKQLAKEKEKIMRKFQTIKNMFKTI